MARLAVSRFAVPLIVVFALGAAAPLATAAPSAAARTVKVSVAGIDRAGAIVKLPLVTLLGPGGQSYYYQGSPISIPAGNYFVGGGVPSYSGATVVSQTLVVRHVRITSAGTIRLDARGGRLLRVALRGATARLQSLSATACMYTPGDGDGAGAGATGGPGVAVYVVPMKSSLVSFAYASQLQAASGAAYYLTGASGSGLPSRPRYQQSAGRLARVSIVLHTGTEPGSLWYWSIAPAGKYDPFFCGPGFGQFQATSPQSTVAYVSPGPWQTQASLSVGGDNRAGYLTEQATYAARHSYLDELGGAVVGPVNSFPAMAGFHFSFGPELFSDPVANGTYCCSTTQVTLRSGGRVVKRETLGSSNESGFDVRLHHAGWYELDATGKRSLPGGATGALLSGRVTLAWRFHAARTSDWTAFPVTETVYQALGLNLADQAPAHGRTTLQIRVMRPANVGSPAPVYRLTTVRVEASGDGGKTWQVLRLSRHGRYWTAVVPDPASGNVALRSIVADTHGDRSEQTIYGAYSIG